MAPVGSDGAGVVLSLLFSTSTLHLPPPVIVLRGASGVSYTHGIVLVSADWRGAGARSGMLVRFEARGR